MPTLTVEMTQDRIPSPISEVNHTGIVEMIVQQRPLEEILRVICADIRVRLGLGVAFFIPTEPASKIVTDFPRPPEIERVLARIDVAALSDSLLERYSLDPEMPGFPLESGWAKCLCSGTGEVVGICLVFAGRPVHPSTGELAAIESACRLAALAIDQKNLLEELNYKANHDSLTGLVNRQHYEYLVAGRLQQNRTSGRQAALLYINLDRFRLVNNVLGHTIGNRLLQQVGTRFGSCLAEGDVLARVGGDEFTVLLPGLSNAGSAVRVGEHLLEALKTPFSVDGHQLFLSASIGIGCSTPDSTPESLEREAYIALHHAKMNGKARLALFHPGIATTPPERLEMEKRLHFAIAEHEMVLYYQPQIDLQSKLICGAEALLRWRPADLGIVSPAAFLPILEETGMIVDFGRWVLYEACRQGRQWQEETGSRVRLGVNVSAIQFARPDFLKDVENALSETGFPAEFLELELTESLFVGDFGSACTLFNSLNSLGVQLALDDFGTGQSALSYLQNLPFRRLKVDQSFIRPVRDDEGYSPLVESIIRMGQSLGMSTIAEGVETEHQAELLRGVGCDEGQGYLWAKPMPASEFAAFSRSCGLNGARER